MQDNQHVLNAEQAAEYLHLHVTTLLRLAREGTIRGKRKGKDWQFLLDDLGRWLMDQVY